MNQIDYVYFQIYQKYVNSLISGQCKSQGSNGCRSQNIIDQIVHDPNIANIYPQLEGIKTHELSRWYQLWNGKDKMLSTQLTVESLLDDQKRLLIYELGPLEDKNGKSMGTQQISKLVTEIRDSYLRAKISEELNEGGKVQVIYGKGHLFGNLNVLKESLKDHQTKVIF